MPRALLSILVLACLAVPAARGQEAADGPSVNEVAQGWLARANFYSEQGQWNDAKNAYLAYLKETPNDVMAISDLGVCYQQLGDYDRALRNFDRALVLSPDHWQALYNKVLVLGFHLGRKDQARRQMRRLLTLQPDNPDVRRLAGDLAKL